MNNELIEVKSNGIVSAKQGTNKRTPYEHQKDAMKNLDIMDEESSFSTLVVLPTGGGKTYTASLWLLKHALNRHKKILWIAHRQMLLDQAAESFQKYAYAETMPNVSSFQYRIVSGATSHDRTIDIAYDDNLLIASKDSLGRNIQILDKWLGKDDEVYLVVDEAHHSTAKTYRKIIDYVRKKVKNTKVIGLTATPFRTAESEQGLLGRIYTDGIKAGRVVKDDIGITYQISLKELINKRILSKPIIESCVTEEAFGENLGIDDWEQISHLDVIPESIAKKMADSAARNKLIVDTYKNNQKIYGQTIVFAVNVIHAITLASLFNKAGIPADYVVSDVKDITTGVSVSREDNEKKLEKYRQKKIKVLVNVNILTEGVDLPQTESVFLARPTVSTILMTQMIGRALRGEAAGGTPDAHIVSFIDNWNEHIAWVNPESLFIDNNDFSENEYDRQQHDVRMIAISKIEEFAKILDDAVDTTALEKVPFEKRIPLGMYIIKYTEENGMDHSCQVMVYDSTMCAYEQMTKALPDLFKEFGMEEEEFIDEVILSQMADQIRDTFFLGEMIPPYEEKDIKQILKFYAQNEAVPPFYTFDDVDKSKLDVASIAKHILDNRLDRYEEKEYVDSLWNSTDDNILRLLFGRKLYFLKQLEIEIMKLSEPELFETEGNVKYGTKEFADMSLYEIRKYRDD